MTTLFSHRKSLLAAAALSILVAGCSSDSAVTNDAAASSSRTIASRRSVASMMATSSAFSVAAMERSSSPAAMEGAYNNGTYTAEGTYRSPAGAEQIDVSVTLKDGIITATTVTGKATNAKSVRLQGAFAEGYQAIVVGKSIDDVSLTVVNGSSLTGKGFMDALTKIKAEAKA